MTTDTANYDRSDNTVVDSTRGNLLTDVQMDANDVPMKSTTVDMALRDNTRHEISTILNRPVNLGTFVWKTSDEPLPITLDYSAYLNDTPNYLQKLDFPQVIFQNSPLVVDKLKNLQYLKADMEIELKWNANPFLQGALMMVYNPYYSQTSAFRSKGTRFMASQTSCPYKVLSIEEGNSFKLTVPYCNLYDLFDLSNTDNQFGTIFIYVFNSLIGWEAEEEVKYTIFARFVESKFRTATSKDVLSVYRDNHDMNRLKRRGYQFAQAAGPTAPRDTGEVTTRGPISQVAGGISMIADVFSRVPLIGSAASSVAWVSRVIGKTAAVFGLSKSLTIQPQTTNVVKPVSTLVHTEGRDDAITLALINDNGIDGSSFIPESADEMALDYIQQRPNYFHAKTVNSVQFSGRKLLTKFEVSPFSEYQYGNSEDSQTLFLGSFAYSSMFAPTLWSGAINFDIFITKTPYHQGRFAVVFYPETNMADVPDLLGEELNTNYCVVGILKDRQDQMARVRYRVTVPFTSNTPTRETYKRTTNVTNPGPDATTLDTKTGCIGIYSLVDLSSTNVVADQVTFNIAHSAGPGYSVSRPLLNLAPGFQDQYAQSDTGAFMVPENENLLIPDHSPCDISAQTTGEYFKSLRALIKRFNKVAELGQSASFTAIKTRSFAENPITGERVMNQRNFDNPVLPTSWYMTSFLYRFYNGSSQLKVIPPVPASMAEAFISIDEDLTQVTLQPDTLSYGQPIFEQQQQMSNALEIRTPFYRGIRGDVIASTQKPILGDVRTNVRVRNLAGYGSTSVAAPMYEAAGDDFSFYFLVGPPPMVDIRNVTTITSFPSGATVGVDFSGVTVLNLATEPFSNTLAIRGVDFNPDLLDQPSSLYGNISETSLATITVTYTDATMEEIPVLDCVVAKHVGVTPTFYVPANVNKTVNLSATLTSIQSTGLFNILTDYPFS